MYFQLKVEANTNFQLIASIKNNLKMAEDQIAKGNDSLSYFYLDLKVLCCLDLLLLESIFFKCKLWLFEQWISLTIFTSIRYT